MNRISFRFHLDDFRTIKQKFPHESSDVRYIRRDYGPVAYSIGCSFVKAFQLNRTALPQAGWLRFFCFAENPL